MNPDFLLAKLLREFHVSDRGILEVQQNKMMSNPGDREQLRGLLLWVTGYLLSHPPAAPKPTYSIHY